MVRRDLGDNIMEVSHNKGTDRWLVIKKQLDASNVRFSCIANRCCSFCCCCCCYFVCCCSCYTVHYSCCSRSIEITLLLEQEHLTECLVLFIVFLQMKEDVEMTELALAFPLFDDSDKNANLGKRHQVKCTALFPQAWIIVNF